MKRPLFHFVGGMIFPVFYYFTERNIALYITFAAFVLIMIFEWLRRRYAAFNAWIIIYFGGFLKEKEKSSVTAMPSFVGGALLTIFFFEKPAAITALLFLTCGDVTAAVFGRKFGNNRVFGLKTLEGTLAFFTVVVLAGLLLKNYVFPHYLNSQSIIIGALLAAIVEVLPIPLDDNLTVPVCSGFILQLLR